MLNSLAARVAIGIFGLAIILIGIAMSQPLTRQLLLNTLFSGFWNGQLEKVMARQPLLIALKDVDDTFYGDVRESIRQFASDGNLTFVEAVPRYRTEFGRYVAWKMGQAGDATLNAWLDNLVVRTGELSKKGRPDLCASLIFGQSDSEGDALLEPATLTETARTVIMAFDDPGPPTGPADDTAMQQMFWQLRAEYKHYDAARFKTVVWTGWRPPIERNLADLMANRGPPALVCAQMRRVLMLIQRQPPDRAARLVRRLMIPGTLPQPQLTMESSSASRESRLAVAQPKETPPAVDTAAATALDLLVFKLPPDVSGSSDVAAHDDGLAKPSANR